MEINGVNLCIGCMQPIFDGDECPHCHLKQKQYKPIPRCLLPGTELAGRYVLGKVLGEGNFGITYIGWDRVLQAPVAVKEYYPADFVSRDVIRGADSNVYVYEGSRKEEYQENLNKFLNEARCLTRFNQWEGIVSVRDFFYENQTAYIIMEYVSGISVKEHIQKNGPMSAKEVLRLMKPLLETLARVHHTGMVHRDISPDNILFSEQGELVLIDFGSARMRNVEMTHSMTVVFKSGFSPEEQYRSHSKQGAWSDIYAICATMYFMLTGKVPEDAITRMIGVSMPSLIDMDEVELSIPQKEALMKGISVRAEERYQNIERLLADLYSEENDRSMTGKRISLKNFLAVGCTLLAVSAVFLVVFLSKRTNPAAVSDTSFHAANIAEHTASMIPTSSPEPVHYKMINCKKLTKRRALKRLKQLGCKNLIVKYKKAYSSTVGKNRIIQQSVKPGTIWKQGEKMVITLTLSRGKKPSPTSKPTSKPTPEPTQKPKPTSKPTSKPKKEKGNSENEHKNDFAAVIS